MSVLLELIKRDDFQSRLFGGLQSNRWRHAVVVGLLPARSTDTPMVTWLQSRKSEFRNRSRQVIALSLAVGQEPLCHDATDTVLTKVSGIGSAGAVSVPTGHGFTATSLKMATQNVENACVGVSLHVFPGDLVGRILPDHWHIARQGG